MDFCSSLAYGHDRRAGRIGSTRLRWPDSRAGAAIERRVDYPGGHTDFVKSEHVIYLAACASRISYSSAEHFAATLGPFSAHLPGDGILQSDVDDLRPDRRGYAEVLSSRRRTWDVCG